MKHESQVWFHTAHVDPLRTIAFRKADFDTFQAVSPVTRLEIVPGGRPEIDLMAPEVKFVRKKAKKKIDALGFLNDILTPRAAEDEQKDETARPHELRQIGKVCVFPCALSPARNVLCVMKTLTTRQGTCPML